MMASEVGRRFVHYKDIGIRKQMVWLGGGGDGKWMNRRSTRRSLRGNSICQGDMLVRYFASFSLAEEGGRNIL